jgi:hypothetical protein
MRKALALLAAGFAAWGWPEIAPPAAPASAAEEFDWQGLPPGKGREEVFYLCGPCHSLRLVTQQGLSRDRWDELLDWMVAKQAMPKPDDGERRLMLDYLAEFYGPDRKARGGKL